MGRFLVGVLFALALFWGYETYWRDGGAEAGQHAQVGGFEEVGDPHPPAPGAAASDPDLESQEPSPATADDAVAKLAEGVAAGDAEARRRAFAALAALDGRRRDPLAAALVAAGREASSFDELVATLGDGNAFLHTEEGRQLFDRALAAVPQVGDRGAQLTALSRLVELSADGAIAKGDEAARAAVDRLRERHRVLVRQVAFDPTNAAGAKRHVVQTGESLDRIAAQIRKQMGVPMEAGTIALFNRISNPNVLQADQALKIPLDPIRTVVFKRSFLVAVYCGDTIVRTYWCAHGREGHDTPEATFGISAKIAKPDWHFEGRVVPYGHPDNPLGTHFVKFEHEAYTGFGIHGTTEPETIGMRASLGCIRLGADDIADYFLLVPRGTEVEVRS